MRIEAVEDLSVAERSLASISRFDILIFVSRNVVKYACQLIPDLPSRAKAKMVFAIGAGTYEALLDTGFTDVSYAEGNTGSEALLGLGKLQSEHVAGKNILILRGVGGRELLRDKLRQRGAKVEYVELYRRQVPELQAATIKNIWLVEKPDVVQVSSAEGLQNLLNMTDAKERPLFLKTPLVVISPRLKEVAELEGFSAEVKIAKSYSDDDIVLALKDMFEAIENE
jgi:uroporphyrinogen-III synthase